MMQANTRLHELCADDAEFQLDPSDVTVKAHQVAQSIKATNITAQDTVG